MTQKVESGTSVFWSAGPPWKRFLADRQGGRRWNQVSGDRKFLPSCLGRAQTDADGANRDAGVRRRQGRAYHPGPVDTPARRSWAGRLGKRTAFQRGEPDHRRGGQELRPTPWAGESANRTRPKQGEFEAPLERRPCTAPAAGPESQTVPPAAAGTDPQELLHRAPRSSGRRTRPERSRSARRLMGCRMKGTTSRSRGDQSFSHPRARRNSASREKPPNFFIGDARSSFHSFRVRSRSSEAHRFR